MAQNPTTIQFRGKGNTSQSRIQLDHVYTVAPSGFSGSIYDDLVTVPIDKETPCDAETLLKREMGGKELFLGTLNGLLKKKKHAVDSKAVFKEVAEQSLPSQPFFWSSHPLLVLQDFSQIKAIDGGYDALGDVIESTTRYGFRFSFLPYPADVEPQTKFVNLPIFAIDSRPWEVLMRHGVDKDMRQRYCENFLRMGEMSEHDYLHHLLLKSINRGDYRPINSRTRSASPTEEHALAQHAQICDALFSDPKTGAARKTKVLSWAAEQFELIAQMEKLAKSNSTPIEWRAIGEAATYLAEIYAHRLFRVISPNDPALNQPVPVTGSDQKISVIDAVNKIQIQIPMELMPISANGIPTPFERLRVSMDSKLGPLYATIHEIHTMDLKVGEKGSASKVPLVTITARLAESSPMKNTSVREKK